MKNAWLALLLLGCHSAVDPRIDASTDSGPAFEVRLEHSAGVPIEDGDALEVTYGCQGGAHTFFDVVALGSGLDGALLDVSMLDRAYSYTLTGTPSGAEYRVLMFLLAESIAPRGLPLPLEATLRATVTRADAQGVTTERSVVLVEGMVCGGGCQYTDVAGTARLTEVATLTETGCALASLAVRFDFVVDTITYADQSDVLLVAPDCVSAMGIAVGAELPVLRSEIIPGTGTCTPIAYDFTLDSSPCEAICPP